MELGQSAYTYPKWFPVFLSGIGLVSLALSNLFW
ncbi:hypothetical protein GGR34_001098 [Microvirga flocculans]|uniref:Uncharacterized protein n=1 Tax=Microvirga flocculans TaxID=217168 RepID=A0A7W6IDH5_9HYPH|nr:hypothetical protein [Microvirga flocculans]